ncbi:MAG: AAA family ATPase [Polyangiaceae bacterium]
MYIHRLRISNYRNFGPEPFVLELRPFTLILGENNVGKTNLLNAIGLLFSQEIAATQRRVLQLDDFHYSTVRQFKQSVVDQNVPADKITFPEIKVEAALRDFDVDQEAVVGDWFTDSRLETALVTYRFALRPSFDPARWIANQRATFLKPTATGQLSAAHWMDVEFPIADYRYTIYGGGASGNECDGRQLRMLRAELLDALRDARAELSAGRDNRLLYRILSRGADTRYADLKSRLQALEDCVKKNQNLTKIKEAVQELLHRVSLQSAPNENVIDFQFSSPDAAELLKKIGMVYGVDPVTVARNGLGRNNLLYLSLVLSQLAQTSSPDDDSYACFRFVGLEEPEAHLHPHLQDHLARNVEAIRKERDKNIQLVMTSHSTHIASKLDLANTVVLFKSEPSGDLRSHYVLSGLDNDKHADAISTTVLEMSHELRAIRT